MGLFKKIGQGGFTPSMLKNDGTSDISLFDVKELYDIAYEDKAKARACLKLFKRRLAQAHKLNDAYQAQSKRYGWTA